MHGVSKTAGKRLHCYANQGEPAAIVVGVLVCLEDPHVKAAQAHSTTWPLLQLQRAQGELGRWEEVLDALLVAAACSVTDTLLQLCGAKGLGRVALLVATSANGHKGSLRQLHGAEAGNGSHKTVPLRLLVAAACSVKPTLCRQVPCIGVMCNCWRMTPSTPLMAAACSAQGILCRQLSCIGVMCNCLTTTPSTPMMAAACSVNRDSKAALFRLGRYSSSATGWVA